MTKNYLEVKDENGISTKSKREIYKAKCGILEMATGPVKQEQHYQL